MPLSIMRNERNSHHPDQKTWAEIAQPLLKRSHTALFIGGDSQHAVEAVQDMKELQKTFGGELFAFTGSEWNALCEGGGEHLRPVGAQFTKTYWILVFSLSN